MISRCPNCGRKRVYNPDPKRTKKTDLRSRSIQCFYCGKYFCPVPKV